MAINKLSTVNSSTFSRNRKIRALLANIFVFSTTMLTLGTLGAILGYILIEGGPLLSLELLTSLPPSPGSVGGGVGNALLGTVLIVSIAAILCIPLGVAASLYLWEFDRDSFFSKAVVFGVDIMAGIPSIIAGVFAYIALIKSGIIGFSALAGAVALSLIMLPVIIKTCLSALAAVEQDIRLAAFGLGAYNHQTALRVVLPAAVPGITTGVLLAIARAAGETAPLIFTALFSNFWVSSTDEPIASLSVLVYNFSSMPFPAQQELAKAAALILVLTALCTIVITRVLTQRSKVL